MPPWPSSRFTLSNAAPTPASSSQTPPVTGNRQKPLPRVPPELSSEPLSPSRAGYSQNGQQPIPSPTRPTTSGGDRHHSHNRSMSNPLPKLFSRKKSTPALGLPGDLPLDDALVPVLEGSLLTHTPTRIISGKKNDDDRNMATRHCLCCDNKVRFPRDLKVFRCTSCLTVNDLEPYRSKPRDGHGPAPGGATRRADTFPREPLGPRREFAAERVVVSHTADCHAAAMPLSVERSRAIIDSCLMAYLHARCQRQIAHPTQTSADPFVNNDTEKLDKSPQPDTPTPVPEPSDSPVEASATIKNMTDFGWYPLSPSYNKVPSSAKPSPAPVSSSPLPGTIPVPCASSIPPVPGRRPPPPPGHSLSLPLRAAEAMPTQTPPAPPKLSPDFPPGQINYNRVKTIFKQLEDYMLATYGDFDCLNSSFSTVRPRMSARARSESAIRTPPPEPSEGAWQTPSDSLQNMDAKMLMIGDFAENGQWWTGRDERNNSGKADKLRGPAGERKRLTTSRTPHINWDELTSFYTVIHTAGNKWWERLAHLNGVDESSIQRNLKGPKNAQEIDNELTEAREHAERALLKITENLLKRPGRALTEPDNVRFLMIILMNPLLYPDNLKARARAASGGKPGLGRVPSQPQKPLLAPPNCGLTSPPKRPGLSLKQPMREPEQHTGIRKRILGLMAHSSDSCHRYLVGWLCRLPEARFVRIVDLVASFVTYRLLHRKSKTPSSAMPQDGGLIPDLSGSARNTSAQLRSATGLGGSVRVKDMETQSVVDYGEDWQLRAAAKVMALLFAANNSWQPRQVGLTPAETNMTSLSRPRAKTHGQLLPTSDYYNTLLDYHDLVADFKAWESKKAKFAFCQYPFFLSMGVKIKVLEYDAHRQMELKAREAYFDSVTNHRSIEGYLHLRVRRECMVGDSLQQISAAVGSGQEELKKGLKVHFTDEEGVDAGGLRKEWFLMIVRDIFDPNHGRLYLSTHRPQAPQAN